MIDIHSHLLHGIDDGAKTLQEALALAKYAVKNGITHSVLTPHIHHGRYENNYASISNAYQQLNKALLEQNIPLKIAFSAEVRISVEIVEMINNSQIPFLGNEKKQRYILLEMPHSHILPGSDNLIEWLLEQQITPIIAHPERNKELQKKHGLAEKLINMGCSFQLTAASISGAFGEICKTTSQVFLEKGWVSFVATDAHNLRSRPPDLLQSISVLHEIIGITETDNLLIHNPWKIVASKFNREPV